MARYRKVEMRVWGDKRFRALSAAPPNGQTLWLYLLTGPRTTIFPGLVVGGEAAMAEDLGWPLSAFREAFAEAFREGLVEASWKHGVVVLKKALFDSMGDVRETAAPQSPNVIRGWAKEWEEVPECELTYRYLSDLGMFCAAIGPSFAEAFGEAFRKALAEASRHPSPIQDQDQDQDIERDVASLHPPKSMAQGTLIHAPVSEPKPKKSRKRPAVSLPENWTPPLVALPAWFDVDQEAGRFRDHHLAKGSVFSDWNAAWRLWVRNAEKFRAERSGSAANSNSHDDGFMVNDPRNRAL